MSARAARARRAQELQRLNIKRAIKFMLDNYDLRDRFVTASAFAPLAQQQQATDYAQTAVESLIQILEYFPDKLTVNDLSREQSQFVLAALSSTSKAIDSFLTLMPPEAVEGARLQVAEENRLNEQEFEELPKDEKLDILNAPKKRAPPPPPPPADPAASAPAPAESAPAPAESAPPAPAVSAPV